MYGENLITRPLSLHWLRRSLNRLRRNSFLVMFHVEEIMFRVTDGLVRRIFDRLYPEYGHAKHKMGRREIEEVHIILSTLIANIAVVAAIVLWLVSTQRRLQCLMSMSAMP